MGSKKSKPASAMKALQRSTKVKGSMRKRFRKLLLEAFLPGRSFSVAMVMELSGLPHAVQDPIHSRIVDLLRQEVRLGHYLQEATGGKGWYRMKELEKQASETSIITTNIPVASKPAPVDVDQPEESVLPKSVTAGVNRDAEQDKEEQTSGEAIEMSKRDMGLFHKKPVKKMSQLVRACILYYLVRGEEYMPGDERISGSDVPQELRFAGRGGTSSFKVLQWHLTNKLRVGKEMVLEANYISLSGSPRYAWNVNPYDHLGMEQKELLPEVVREWFEEQEDKKPSAQVIPITSKTAVALPVELAKQLDIEVDAAEPEVKPKEMKVPGVLPDVTQEPEATEKELLTSQSPSAADIIEKLERELDESRRRTKELEKTLEGSRGANIELREELAETKRLLEESRAAHAAADERLVSQAHELEVALEKAIAERDGARAAIQHHDGVSSVVREEHLTELAIESQAQIHELEKRVAVAEERAALFETMANQYREDYTGLAGECARGVGEKNLKGAIREVLKEFEG